MSENLVYFTPKLTQNCYAKQDAHSYSVQQETTSKPKLNKKNHTK